VRKETTVLLRGNDHAYERMPLFGKARVQLIGPEADLAQTLELAVTQINAEWWVDLGTRLVQDERGAELFLDRRYDACDVAVSGSYFHQLSQEESTWARKRGADKGRWTEGSLLKLPKLSGTPTLWRHEFCRRLYAEWGKHPQIPIPVLLALWQETGKARPVTCSARDQGWNARL
jgi:hypothetical protein